MFTPGGIGATLSPTSAIFFTTTPAKGARIRVFWSWASLKPRSALACASAASAILTRLAAASRWSTASDVLAGQVLGEPQLALALGEVGLGPLHGRARALHRRLVVDRLEPGEHLAGADDAALLDAQLGEAALDLGRDDGLAARDHVAGGREHRRSRARRHVARDGGRRRRDLGRREGLLRPPGVEAEQHQRDREQQQQRPAPRARARPLAVDLEGSQLTFQVRHGRSPRKSSVPKVLRPPDPGSLENR